MLRSWIVIVSLLAVSVATAQDMTTLAVGGTFRSYALHLPNDIAPAVAAPLVVVLHGKNLSARDMVSLTDFNRVADDNGFMVVYPQGERLEWNYFQAVPGYPSGTDDLAFIDALLEELSANYLLDKAHMYLVGFSNGGFMTQRLACARPGLFAAHAVVGATAFFELPEVCAEVAPASMLFIHGTADRVLPYDNSPYLPPLSQSVGFWGQQLGCDSEATFTDLTDTGEVAGISVVTLANCAGGNRVQAYLIKEGGHNWPGNKTFIPADIAGKVADLDASTLIWNFFSSN